MEKQLTVKHKNAGQTIYWVRVYNDDGSEVGQLSECFTHEDDAIKYFGKITKEATKPVIEVLVKSETI